MYREILCVQLDMVHILWCMAVRNGEQGKDEREARRMGYTESRWYWLGGGTGCYLAYRYTLTIRQICLISLHNCSPVYLYLPFSLLPFVTG